MSAEQAQYDPSVARYMAEALIGMVAVVPIPEHAVGLPDEPPPAPVAPPDPATLAKD
ncbi:hypothetical protein [Streptomyces sp. NPDC001292]|uniref:hypothetical protein n=1 Tax=Streptomyces sp. NPDC001292 TaxID=3364558 RepID=UPI0036844AC3